jgi:Protein of unknown function (DUF3568)
MHLPRDGIQLEIARRRFEPQRKRDVLPRHPKADPLNSLSRTLASLGLLVLLPLWTGCGALLLVGGAGTSAVAWATGELRSTERTPLARLDVACATAVDALGYGAISTEREQDRIRWRARTAGGDPVDIRLLAQGQSETEVRIRIGVFGDEAKSRLVLEEIRQAL